MLASVSAASIVSRASSVSDKLTLRADFDGCGCCALDPRAAHGRSLLRFQLVALPMVPIFLLIAAITARTYLAVVEIGKLRSAAETLDAWGARRNLSLALQEERRAVMATILDPSGGNLSLQTVEEAYRKTDALLDISSTEIASLVRDLREDIVGVLGEYMSLSNMAPTNLAQSYVVDILQTYEQLLNNIDTGMNHMAADAVDPRDDTKIDWIDLFRLQNMHYFVSLNCLLEHICSNSNNFSDELIDISRDNLYRYKLVDGDNIEFGIQDSEACNTSSSATPSDGNISHLDDKAYSPSNMSCQSFLQVVSNEILSNITSMSRKLERSTRGRIARCAALQIASVCVALVCALFVGNNARITTASIHVSAYLCACTVELILKDKRRCELLLREMLPKEIIKRLRVGTFNANTHAHEYASVSVYFSDVVGFDEITSTTDDPMNVVRLLNDIYMAMDEKIDEYDVYKVETIGSTYMVASGLPVENGERHASEIAAMALDLLRTTRLIKVPHMPGRKVQLRTGIHTGPCCAGVVGNKMPRYCLFGDTVNTASRLQTSGLALKIQISEQTYLALRKDETFVMDYRGAIYLKGKGTVDTYWLISQDTKQSLRTRVQMIPHGSGHGEDRGARGSGDGLELTINVPQYSK